METTECFQLTAECGSKYELCRCAHFYFLALSAAVHLLSFSLSLFLFCRISTVFCLYSDEATGFANTGDPTNRSSPSIHTYATPTSRPTLITLPRLPS